MEGYFLHLSGMNFLFCRIRVKKQLQQPRNLMNSEVWKTIPAVQNKRVYTLDSSWNFDDAITRERLL
ncbi:hypothetical protein [Paenibacillus polymyxa]|uniref:hypothetical protein n=1 Tax=Paenibacillus polymyxa TaxID=1406 RepID=UPI001E320BD5|nr:hypothetical protein [Paenibacillus polymyxa]WPQ59359.1 hypothetical protein SKN87_11205 [Paenibacillus polymyxa]